MTRALLGMVDRLAELGVTLVVMESTVDYWKPPVRHEALWNRVEVRGLRRWSSQLAGEAGGSPSGGTRVRVGAAPTTSGRVGTVRRSGSGKQ